MRIVPRLALTIILVAITALCCFGFLASYEQPGLLVVRLSCGAVAIRVCHRHRGRLAREDHEALTVTDTTRPPGTEINSRSLGVACVCHSRCSVGYAITMRFYDSPAWPLLFFAGAIIIMMIVESLGLTPRWIRDLIAPQDGSDPEPIEDDEF
jgi:hypothetical protein